MRQQAQETDPLIPPTKESDLERQPSSTDDWTTINHEYYSTECSSTKAVNDGDDNDNSVSESTVFGSIMETINNQVENIVIVTENIATGIGEVTNAAGGMATDVKDAIVEEVFNMTDVVMEELHEAEQGELYFLDMSLARNLSMLPTDMQVLAHEHAETYADTTTPTTAMNNQAEFTEYKKPELASTQSIPPTAYLGLASAVMSLSAIGPLLARQYGASGCTRIFWRMFGTSIVLLPFAIGDVKRTGMPRLSTTQWITFFLGTASYITMAIAFVLSLSYTTVGNAMILSNSQAIMLLAGNLLVGSPITWFEGIGAIGAFIGAVFCSRDSSEVGGDNSGPSGMTLYGDALALLSGLGGVGYLVFAKTTRLHLSMFVFTFLTMIVGSLMTLSLQLFVLHETVTWDRNLHTGVFGFLNLEMDRLPLEIAIVLICNVCGTMGYIRAMAFFDSLVISVAGLMEPVCSVLLACLLGVGVLPGWKGWFGNFLVGIGTLAVIYPSSKKKGAVAH